MTPLCSFLGLVPFSEAALALFVLRSLFKKVCLCCSADWRILQWNKGFCLMLVTYDTWTSLQNLILTMYLRAKDTFPAFADEDVLPEVCWEGPRKRKEEVLRLHEFQHMFVSFPQPVKQKLPHLALSLLSSSPTSILSPCFSSLQASPPLPPSPHPLAFLSSVNHYTPSPAQIWLNWVVWFGCRHRLHLFTCSPGSYPHLEGHMCFLFKHTNLNGMNWYLRFAILSAWASPPSFFYNSAFIIFFS